jgi:predicted transcriptional regulator
MPPRRFYFDPHAKGLRVFLGPTEARLMELIWTKGDVTVKKALRYMGESAAPAYTSVMTVLARLAEKGILNRSKDGRFYIYSATGTREQFLRDRISMVRKCLDANFGDKA